MRFVLIDAIAEPQNLNATLSVSGPYSLPTEPRKTGTVLQSERRDGKVKPVSKLSAEHYDCPSARQRVGFILKRHQRRAYEELPVGLRCCVAVFPFHLDEIQAVFDVIERYNISGDVHRSRPVG